jgi:hypothetical protein
VADVRSGSKPEVAAVRRHVRFAPINGHRQAVSACPKNQIQTSALLGACGAEFTGEVPVDGGHQALAAAGSSSRRGWFC